MDKDRIQSAIDHIKTAVDLDPWAVELAVAALEAFGKDTNVPCNNDLISRQAAIDALEKHEEYEGHNYTLFRSVVSECAEIIRELPSAQPEQSLDIQHILEYLDTVLHPIISPDHWSVYSELHDMISMLPSAQPEIIHCKDCKHFEYDHLYVVQGTLVMGHLVCNKWGDGCRTAEEGFCFMAERREDG